MPLVHRQRHPSSQLGWTVLLLGQVINTLQYVFISIKENSTLNKMSFLAGRLNRSPLTLNLRINRLCSFSYSSNSRTEVVFVAEVGPHLFLWFLLSFVWEETGKTLASHITHSVRLVYLSCLLLFLLYSHSCPVIDVLVVLVLFVFSLSALANWWEDFIVMFLLFIVFRLSSVSGCFSIVWG